MSGPFAALTRSIRPTALSAFGLFTTQTLSRPSSSTASLAKCTKFLVRPASEVTPRECPTPLVLLRMKNLGETSMAEDWSSWGGIFAERGYTAVEVDIEAGESSAGSTKNLMDGMVSELAHQIRLMAIPFAPIIIAAESSTLLSQSYISSHPASGLVLISPPHSATIATANSLDEPLPELTYEPHFPVLVVASDAQAKEVQAQNRLVRDYADRGVGRGGKGVSFEKVPNVYSEQSRMAIERWMDSCGF